MVSPQLKDPSVREISASRANVGLLLEVLSLLAVECENVTHFGKGHDVRNLTDTYCMFVSCVALVG